MKRGALKGRSVKGARYIEEFEQAKIEVQRRSKGICEAAPFVAQHLQPTIEYQDAVREFLRVECGRRVDHTHHRKYRSRGGTNSLSNLLGICQAHHDFAHAHGGFGEPANVLRLALSAGEDESL